MKILYKMFFYLFERSRIRQCIRELGMEPVKFRMNGHSIFYLQKHGSPDYPTLILVHGFLDSGYGFRKLLKHLHYPGRILVPDLPGYGRSRLPKMGYLYQLDVFADLLKAWINSLPLENSNLILIGHSMGGLIVQKIALSHNSSDNFQIQGLVLLASGGVPHPRRDEMRDVLFPKTIRDISILLGYLYHSRIPEPNLIIMNTLLNEWNGWKNKQLAENTIRRELEIFHGDKMKKIDHPTLILVGNEDELTTPAMMKSIQKWIKGSTLHILKDTRHALQNEKPEQVAHLIREFLKY